MTFKIEKIACPYDWDCGNSFSSNEMYDSESESLETAINQKMTVTFIHCPKCTRMFLCNAVDWEGKLYFAKNPNEKSEMIKDIVEIDIYNRKERVLSTISVERIGENRFRTTANEIIDNRLTYRTEFETTQNYKNQHEISSVDKNSDYITRRFYLTPKFKESEYKLLGDEIMKEGGFWQVDFGSMVTVNIPIASKLDLDEIFKIFDFYPNEIFD